MAKSSWRFLFVDVNKSIDITEQDTKWIAYISIRAPKGKTEADFIAPDNADLIKAMYGYPSADYPDIYDAIELNKYRGLYISASAGTSAAVPNYYGGYYLTSKGKLQMYCNTNPSKPNFEVVVKAKEASSRHASQVLSLKDFSMTLASLNEKGKQCTLIFSGIPVELLKDTKEIAFNYWDSVLPFRYAIDLTNGTIHPGSTVTNADAKAKLCGCVEMAKDGTYTITLGNIPADKGVEGSPNTLEDFQNFGIPFLDLTTWAFDYSELYEATTDGSFATWKESDDAKAILAAITSTGKCTVDSTIDLDYGEILADRFRFVYNCKKITKAWCVQKSPTAFPTNIAFSDIVYDKYNFDEKVPYTTKEAAVTADGIVTGFTDGTALPTPGAEGYSDIVKACTTQNPTLIVFSDKASKRKVIEMQTEDDDDGNPVYTWVDVTEESNTKKFLLTGTVLKSIVTEAQEATPAVGEEGEEGYIPAKPAVPATYAKETNNKDLTTAIIFVNKDAAPLHNLFDKNEDADIRANLTVNNMYNSFTMKATEIDENDEIHAVGPFTGSLDETAVDQNGSDFFWEDIYPADSATYVEMYVQDTFDEDLDDHGYYTGVRVTNDLGSDVTGQRYLDKIIAENIANGNTGSNVTDADPKIQKQFAKVVKESMIEAAKPKYEDARLFVETTGLESIKNYFTVIRTNHKMATIISPKNINEQIFNKISAMTVEGRCRGSAQFCQELQFKDKNTRKKYYACPIGAVGSMLMRIMELALGGVAPAWLNSGSMGGQLDEFFIGRTPLKARWDFEDLDTKIMDEKGVNPILMDVDDGVMIVSHRTTELSAGDWGYLGHSMAFDECKREIRDNVMKPQLEKKINPYWMNIRQEDTDKILRKRISGSDPIWAKAECDIKGVNNEYTMAQKTFNIAVNVKVYPFSEFVKLTFTNEGQTTSVSD